MDTTFWVSKMVTYCTYTLSYIYIHTYISHNTIYFAFYIMISLFEFSFATMFIAPPLCMIVSLKCSISTNKTFARKTSNNIAPLPIQFHVIVPLSMTRKVVSHLGTETKSMLMKLQITEDNGEDLYYMSTLIILLSHSNAI